MLKRKIFAVALPIIAGATIVGSGFAAWVFDSTTSPENKTLGVELTGTTDLTGVKFKYQFTGQKIKGTDESINPTTLTDLAEGDKINLVLDQGKTSFNSDGKQTTLEADNGIYFTLTRKDTTYLLKTLEISLEDTSGKVKSLYDAGYAVKVNSTLTFDSTLLNYIKIKTADTDVTNTWNNFNLMAETSEKHIYKASNDVTKDLNFGGNKSTLRLMLESRKDGTAGNFYHENTLFSYHETTANGNVKKPTTAKEYKTFKEAVDKITNSITIENSLQIVEANV